MSLRCGAVLCLTALLACRETNAAAPARESAAKPTQAVAAVSEPPAPPRATAKPRSVVVKETSLSDGDVRAGARFVSPRAVELPEAATLTLDFEHGARVRLTGAARALVDLAAQDLLLVGAGTLSVDLPPSAPTPHSGFALLTPACMLSLVRGGRYALRVFEDGSSHGFVVSGTATLRALGPTATSEPVLLSAGEAFVLAPLGLLKRSKHTAGTLAQAEQVAEALRAPRVGGGQHGRPRQRAGPDAERLGALLSAQLSATAPLRARQEALVAEHRALLGTRDGGARDGGAEQLGELQREIAINAAQLAQARAGLRLALGQRAAALQTPALGGDDAPSVEARALLVH